MEAFSISLTLRDETGSSAARRVRREGQIPAIIYHRGEEAITASVDYNQFYNIATRAKSSQLFNIVCDDPRLNGRSALVKDIQQHFVSGKLLHVDFQALRDDEEITVEVPLNIVGEAPGVKLGGGILTVIRHSIKVSCLPKNIPSSLDVSVAALDLGQSIHAGDIQMPTGVEYIGDEEDTIVSITVAGAEEVAATPAEGAAPADGAAAAATPAAAATAEKKPEKKG